MPRMEFWGAEVKSGEALEVDPGDGFVLHLSQACLGVVKKGKGKENIYLFAKFDEQKLVLGTLSSEKFPQISFDLMFGRKFELSHNWKDGSVYFSGYRAYVLKKDESSGKSESRAIQVPKSDGTAVKQVKIMEANKAEDTDDDVDKTASSDEDSSDEYDEDDVEVNDVEESSEDDDSSEAEESNEDSYGETPVKLKAASRKRPNEATKRTPLPDKKTKFITPKKTADGKKCSGHVATPYPSKQAGRYQQTPKPGVAYPCKSCNRSFNSETALLSHTKAKHTAAK